MGAQAQESGFRELYRRELGYVCSSLVRLGVPDRHVDDLAHDVFLVAHRRFADYDRDRPIRPWLFAIAFKTASAFRNLASSRREVFEEPGPWVSAPSRSPEDALMQRQAQLLVLRALEVLDLDKRPVFVMHEIDGYAIPEAAEALDIPLNTAYSRLRRARELFEAEIRRLTEGAT